MATRSVRTILHNNTRFSLTKIAEDLEEGVWTNGVHPPDTIRPKETVQFESESGGEIPIIGGSVAQGTIGKISYSIPVEAPQFGGKGVVFFFWDNPFIGIGDYQYRVHAEFNDAPFNRFAISRNPLVTGTNNSFFNLSGRSEAVIELFLSERMIASVRLLLPAGFDPSKGLRALAPRASVISVRSLIHF